MFEYIRTHQRLMMLLLLLLIFPSFVFFGLESYGRMKNTDDTIAEVYGQAISKAEWTQARRQQMSRLRQMFGDQLDPKMFDTPEAKQAILDNMISQRVLAAEAIHNKLSVSKQALQQTILSMGDLQKPDGKFDVERYKAILARQGMTPAMYEASLRQEMAVQQLNASIQKTAFAPDALAERLSELGEQEREVQQLTFKAADYASKVKVTDAMLKSYYEKSHAFDLPERVKVNYVVLTADALKTQINVSDTDIKSYYEKNAKQYVTPEQRRASHILIAIKQDASDADKAAAKEKAEKLLQTLRQHPDQFEKLAKKNSDDPGSAEHGGDLGFFGKGMMVKPFEDAAFQLKKGEISDLVQSDFGFHIIKVTAIKPAVHKPLAEVKDKIEDDIKKQMLEKKFSETADVFNNTVYEEPDSLKAVADKLHLQIQTVENLTRQPNPAMAHDAPYNNQKFLTVLFADDSLKAKHNTESVEVAPNTLIAGHIVNYKPSSKRPFEEVKATVHAKVVEEEAEKLAVQAGEAKLATLKQRDSATGFSGGQTISRAKNKGVNPTVFMAAMKVDSSKLPAYAGVILPNQGYSVLRVVKVMQPKIVDQAKRQVEKKQIGTALAQQEMLAYVEMLKKKAKVKILKPLDAAPVQTE